jgi:predicted nucleic acid-binding protein
LGVDLGCYCLCIPPEDRRNEKIFQTLKRKNTLIEFRDILIASSSIAHNIPLATLNLKHFDRIDDLNILE